LFVSPSPPPPLPHHDAPYPFPPVTRRTPCGQTSTAMGARTAARSGRRHEGHRRRAQPRRPLEHPHRHRPARGVTGQRRSRLDYRPSHHLRRRLVRRWLSSTSVPQHGPLRTARPAPVHGQRHVSAFVEAKAVPRRTPGGLEDQGDPDCPLTRGTRCKSCRGSHRWPAAGRRQQVRAEGGRWRPARRPAVA
jgi:hypothetical protein